MKNKLLRRRIALITLLAVCLACNGCTTLQPVDIPSTVTQRLATVKHGERVEITLKSGELKKFRVIAVTGESIQGKDANVAYTDISLLEVRKFSVGRTCAVVLGVVVAVSVISLAIFRDALKTTIDAAGAHPMR